MEENEKVHDNDSLNSKVQTIKEGDTEKSDRKTNWRERARAKKKNPTRIL